MNHRHTSHSASFHIGPKLIWTSVVFALIISLSFIPALEKLNESLLSYLGIIWWAVLLGLFLGGLIDHFVPSAIIYRLLGSGRKRSIPYAVGIGFLMSACSHGILAIAIQLYKKGASVPSVVTFLLASPWANLPVTILMFGFFGMGAAFFIGGAMLIALATGFIYMGLEQIGWIETNRYEKSSESADWSNLKNFWSSKSLTGVTAGMVSLSNMVLWWIMIGIMAAALIGAYVPEHIFAEYLGPDLAGLSLTLLFATVIEVCSEGSSPIAFEIFNKVGTLGNPFVFLMAGVVTDYTEIGLIWANIGKRAAILLPIVTVPQVLLLGMLFNSYIPV
jgi:uncharacterized membrane protein YraQ (UPF0718 family)